MATEILKKECELVSLVQDVIDFYSEVCEDRFYYRYSGSIYGLWSSAGIRKVLGLLINNALIYGDKKKPISIDVRQLLDRAQISVYYHLSRQITVQGAGRIGLGMTLVEEIIKGHAGLMKVETGPKNGAEFTVELPFTQG